MACKFGVASAQLNLVVGDLSGNQKKIVDSAQYARDTLGCRFVVFPELTICGYPPEDLLHRPSFLNDCESILQNLTESVSDIAMLVGHPFRKDGKLYNAASLIDGGEILATHCKHHLPNYGVFDEKRYFCPGSTSTVREIDGIKLGITICEDVWEEGPVEEAVRDGAELIFSLNGSPFDIDKIAYREREIVCSRAKRNTVSIVYLNLVGGQDELVFDGGSIVTDAKGRVVSRSPHFEEAITRTTFSKQGKINVLGGYLAKTPSHFESVYCAIKLGIQDYVWKNGFRGAIVGLSGGIDSALTLALIADAIGPENVEAVLMPSRYTRQMSIDDAIEEAENLGVSWTQISIEPVFEAFLNQLAPKFKGLDADTTEENIQARCRGTLLMAISNKTGKIVITTGNKSEVAVGYATLYGDMAGGFAPIKDVPKTMVYELAKYRNEINPVIPNRVLERAPSAELADNQHDSDSLPPYDILDQILQNYVEDGKSKDEIVDQGFNLEDVQKVQYLVNRNEYKRRQAPPGVRISAKAFGRDRRYPITNKY